MDQFTGMTFEQALLHVACYDEYLKYNDGSADKWYNFHLSKRRATGLAEYHRSLHQSDRRMWHAWARGFEELEHNPFVQQPECGSKEWLVTIGLMMWSIHVGTGWAATWNVHDNISKFLKYIDNGTFEEEFDDHIRNGYTCLNICDDCNSYCNIITRTVNDDYVCTVCRDEDYRYDDYHHNWFPSHDAVDAIGPNGEEWTINGESDTTDFTWDDDRECCIHNDYMDTTTVIRGYHAHSDSFQLITSPWSKSNKRHFGVELEVEVTNGNRNDAAKKIHNWFESTRPANEQLLYEEDGSLSNGFEMITNPMGLDKHREIWKWLEQKDLVSQIRSHNTSTCGLHVHVSKKGLSALTISKAVCFVNNPNNQSLIKAIARRYGSGYCRAKHVTLGKGAQGGDKYEMINLSKPYTLEFRIFRGTLNYNAIQAAIEFTNGIINFAASTSMEELTELKFLEFIYKLEQRMDTKFLRTYLEQRSSRIKDIVDRNIKPLYNLRIVKPAPVVTGPDEPAQTPPPRERGSRTSNVSYPEDVAPPDPNTISRRRREINGAIQNHLNTLNGQSSDYTILDVLFTPRAA